MAESKDLLQVLWSGADVLRGKMDANEYKTYLLGLVFYKYLSDSYLAKVYDLLNDEMPDDLNEAQKQYEEAFVSDDKEELLSELRDTLHYTLDPQMTYVSILNDAKNNSFNREKLQAAFNRIQSRMNFLTDCLLMSISILIDLVPEIRSKVLRLLML